MLVNRDVTSKLAITTLFASISEFTSSWTTEKESLTINELVETGVRRGIKNLASLFEQFFAQSQSTQNSADRMLIPEPAG